MKTFKRIVALAIASVMIILPVGCGKKPTNNGVKNTNGGKEVEISYWNSGMGTAYLDKMIEAFNAKQSDYFVYYKASASGEAVLATFGLEDVDTVDLYMGTKQYDTSQIATIDDVLESTADGDKIPLKDKFDTGYLDLEKAADGHYYSLPWGGGAISIVYNKDLFKKAGIEELPRTTSELATVCDKLYSKGITPLTHFRSTGSKGASGYWGFLQELWYAQYEGMDYYINNFYSCTDENGVSPSKEVLTKKDGRYEVLKEMEKFITPEYVLAGSNSQDHVSMQTLFLNQDIGMLANGSWMSNEMESVGAVDKFGVMKTPVLSSITDKLATVKSDTQLRKLISAIDSVTDGETEISKYQAGTNYIVDGKEVSAEDWDYVKTARNGLGTNFPAMTCFIPSYSDNIDGAKEFMKFYYSDEGYKIFTDNLHITLPLSLSEGELDIEEWNSFEKDMYNLALRCDNYVSNAYTSVHKIFIDGGASPYADYAFAEHFCSTNVSDRVTADEAWQTIVERFNNSFDGWVANVE